MSSLLHITSLTNDRVKALVRLRERRERERTGLFLIEEPLVIGRALDAGQAVAEVWTCPELHDDATAALLDAVNREGRIYLTQTTHEGRFVIRVQVGPWDCTRDDVLAVPQALAAAAARL